MAPCRTLAPQAHLQFLCLPGQRGTAKATAAAIKAPPKAHSLLSLQAATLNLLSLPSATLPPAVPAPVRSKVKMSPSHLALLGVLGSELQLERLLILRLGEVGSSGAESRSGQTEASSVQVAPHPNLPSTGAQGSLTSGVFPLLAV